MNKGKKSKLPMYCVYGAIAIAVIIYIIITAMPGKKPAESAPAQTTASESAIAPILPDDTSQTRSEAPVESAPETSESHDVSGAKVVLRSGEDAVGDNDGICYVYVPAGYTAVSNAASVTLSPDGMDMSVTGNRPLRISWGNVPFFDRLKAEKAYEDPKAGAYKIIADYAYAASESASARVYAIEYAPKNSNSQKIYTVAVDVQTNGLYPRLSVTESELRNFLTGRYDTILKLACAIFRPVDPDEIDIAEDISAPIASEPGTSETETSEPRTSEIEPVDDSSDASSRE